MIRRFIVAVEGMTAEQDSAFRDYLNSKRYSWWHWIQNLWIIQTRDTEVDVSTFRDKINEIAPKENSLVVEITGVKNWAGVGPSGKTFDMFKWLHGAWSQDE